MTTRIVALVGRPSPHLVHHMHSVAIKDGAVYQECRCGTRRIVVKPGATYEVGWLRTGTFAGESGSLFTLDSVTEQRNVA